MGPTGCERAHGRRHETSNSKSREFIMRLQSTTHPTPFEVEAPLSRRHQKSGNIETWLHIVLNSLTEAYAAHAIFRRQVQQGVAPSTAIRAAFDLEHDRPTCDRERPGATTGGR